tara:strand:+ start:43 stop:771 length:729 start_codon:yes stop_codon:yes gene_type:complete
MKQKFFYFFTHIVIIFTFIQPVFAEKIVDLNIVEPSKLTERKLLWPNWRSPSFLRRPSFKDDLIYPDWFEGLWDVNSKIDNEKNEESILHSAKFIRNSSGNLVADREYNTQSFALNSKNGDVLSVKNDPKSPNRQFAKLTEDRYLETKIIGRMQEQKNNDLFISDELILQILHSPELSRVSQVEILTEFRKCRFESNTENKLNGFDICAEQFLAIYNEPGQNILVSPIKTQKFKLLFRRTND